MINFHSFSASCIKRWIVIFKCCETSILSNSRIVPLDTISYRLNVTFRWFHSILYNFHTNLISLHFPQVPRKLRCLHSFKTRCRSTEISNIPLRIFSRSRCQIQISWLVATPRPGALSSSSTFQTLISLQVRYDNYKLA